MTASSSLCALSKATHIPISVFFPPSSSHLSLCSESYQNTGHPVDLASSQFVSISAKQRQKVFQRKPWQPEGQSQLPVQWNPQRRVCSALSASAFKPVLTFCSWKPRCIAPNSQQVIIDYFNSVLTKFWNLQHVLGGKLLLSEPVSDTVASDRKPEWPCGSIYLKMESTAYTCCWFSSMKETRGPGLECWT